MIITITPNTVLDQVITVASFEKGKPLKALDSMQCMGGKATDVSYILGTIGIPSIAMGFAAGITGSKIETMLQQKGVTTNFTQVNGDSRLIILIIDQSDQTHTTISSATLEVLPEHIQQLKTKYERMLAQATVVVLGGTLPKGVTPDFYTDLIRMAKDRHIPVIFDAGEPNLSAGLIAKPDYIKPNRDELAGLVGYPIDSVEIAYKAGREVLEKYGVASVITLREQGGIAVLPDRAYFIPPQKVTVASAAGAGDAVAAGLAASIQRKQPIEEGLKLGFATAIAVLLSPGTADCNPDDVDKFLPAIELIPYP